MTHDFGGEHCRINLIRVAEGLGRVNEVAHARRERAELAATDPAKAALNARLTAVLGGKSSPEDEPERIQLAYRAFELARCASSARLYSDALANDPKLVDDRQAGHRYNGACPPTWRPLARAEMSRPSMMPPGPICASKPDTGSRQSLPHWPRSRAPVPPK